MHKELHTEQDLLQRLANGERSAIEHIYKQHYKTIVGWIMKNGGDEHDAADVCQEAVIVLYEKAQQEDFRLTCKVTTYLYAITRNIWYKKVRENKAEPIIADEDQEDNISMNYEEDLKAHNERELYFEQLENALEQLGEPCSSLIRAYYYEDKNMQEIAKRFNYTNADNAKNQKYKCLNRLKKIFYSAEVK